MSFKSRELYRHSIKNVSLYKNKNPALKRGFVS